MKAHLSIFVFDDIWPSSLLISISRFRTIMTRAAGGSDYDFIFKVVLIGDSSVGKVGTFDRQVPGHSIPIRSSLE